MTTQVPIKRPTVDASEVAVGEGVDSGLLRSLQRMVNWLLASGVQTAAINGTFFGLTSSRDYEFPFITHRKYQTRERHVGVKVTGSNPSVQGEGLIAPTTGVGVFAGGQTRIVGPETSSPEWVEDGGAAQTPSEAEQEYWLGLSLSGFEFTVSGTGVWGMPRASLALVDADLGSDPGRVVGGQPYTAGMIKALSNELLIGRRHSFIAWSVPALDGGTPITTYSSNISSTSFVPMFANDGIPVLARQLRVGATTSQIRVKIMYQLTGGGTGEARAVSSQNGNSNTVTLINGPPAWSDAMDLDVDCEDLDHACGLQDHVGSDWDMLNVDVRKITSGTVNVFGVAAWEAGP